MGKFLIVAGIVLIVVGTLWQLGFFKHVPLGRLPGDIVYEGENVKFYFPVATSLLISVLLSLIIYLMRRFM